MEASTDEERLANWRYVHIAVFVLSFISCERLLPSIAT